MIKISMNHCDLDEVRIGKEYLLIGKNLKSFLTFSNTSPLFSKHSGLERWSHPMVGSSNEGREGWLETRISVDNLIP
jgi:glutaredoxin-related protein